MYVIIILLLVIMSGTFATAEMALVSVRKPRLQQWVEEGHANAQTALDLANKPETFLPTAQLGMTLIGILTGAFGQRTLSGHVEAYVNAIPRLAPFASQMWTLCSSWSMLSNQSVHVSIAGTVTRERVNDWYGNTLFSRLNDKDKGAIIIVAVSIEFFRPRLRFNRVTA